MIKKNILTEIPKIKYREDAITTNKEEFKKVVESRRSVRVFTEEKVDANLIPGCTSKAWMVIIKTSSDNYKIKTDSDSHIVSGLLFLLSLSIENKSKNFIDNINGIEILKEVGLDGHITSQRTNGFLSALETLKKKN